MLLSVVAVIESQLSYRDKDNGAKLLQECSNAPNCRYSGHEAVEWRPSSGAKAHE